MQDKTHSRRCGFYLHSPLHGKARSGRLTDGVSRRCIPLLTTPYVQAANPRQTPLQCDGGSLETKLVPIEWEGNPSTASKLMEYFLAIKSREIALNCYFYLIPETQPLTAKNLQTIKKNSVVRTKPVVFCINLLTSSFNPHLYILKRFRHHVQNFSVFSKGCFAVEKMKVRWD